MNRLSRSLKSIKAKDLLFVILYAIFVSILMGLTIGLVDSLLTTQIPFSLSFIFFFLSSRWLGRTIRQQYDYPNLYYVVIAFIGLFIQAVIVIVLQLFASVNNIIEYPEIFLNEMVYVDTFISMLRNTVSGGFVNSLNYLITYLLYGVGIYIGLRETY